MYTKEQEETALKAFERTGSIQSIVQVLGYPSRATLYRWYEHKKAGIKKVASADDRSSIGYRSA
jgi:hypothetical protein